MEQPIGNASSAHAFDFSLAGLILDVDGVLIASPHERAWRESLDALMGGPWDALAPLTSYRAGAFTTAIYQSRVAGKPRLSGATSVLEHFGVPDAASRAHEYAAAKQRQIEALIDAGEFVAFDDALALVIALFVAGYPLAAASSSKNATGLMRRIDARDFANRAGLDAAALGGRRTLLDVFTVNVCGRNVARGKPDPALFLLAAAELGIPPASCVVIEDAPAGVEAAKAAGMWALGVARCQDDALLERAGADVVVNRLDLQQVLPLLAKAARAETTHPSKCAEEASAPGARSSPTEAAFAPTAEPGWVLRETRYDRALESSMEARFAVSNGFLGVRASRAVSRGSAWISWQHTLNWSSWPRTFVAGLFDTPNADPAVPALVPAPDWLRLRVLIDGAPLLLRSGEVVRHWRTLDLRRGLLITEWHQRQSEGRLVRLRTLRLVSLAERALGLQVMELRVAGPPAEVTLDALFEAGSTGLEIVSIQPERSLWRTGLSRKVLAMASSALVRLDGDELPPSARDQSSWTWRWRSHPDRLATLARTVAFARGDLPADDADRRATEALARTRAGGWQGVLDAHVAAWAERWSASDIEIDGDESAQRALRFAAYHLVSAANPDDERVSIGARALTGDAYLGHVFWDTEIYLLPFYTLTWPKAARALLVYRHRTLDGARAKAARMGYRGALYAWESADTGEEVTPEQIVDPEGRTIDVLCGKQEQHISADVAYAVWQYWQTTGDDAFLCDAGAEIVLETARFWASRSHLEADGAYHIRGVIGPDEYHENVDDNAFTNVMARWNLERGLEVIELLAARWPRRLQELRERLELDAGELAHWQEVAHGLVTGFDRESRLFEQFEGYFDLEEIDLAAYADRTQPMDVVLGRSRTQRSRVVKQADVVALLALLPDAFDREVHEANFRYYEPRCGHGSSLSRGLHAVVAARLGDVDLAYRYFCDTAATDLSDTLGASAGGVRIAALGGLWQAAVSGFAGLRSGADGLAVDPHLPRPWRSVRLRVQWRGRRLAVELGQYEVAATLESGAPMPLTVRGRCVTLEPGLPQRIRTRD